MQFKVGIGYDVHKFDKNRKLIIGGVEIPYERGLKGHSDADVLIHAIIDSILGALKEGDIGRLFPDTSEKFKNISSILLLEEVKKILNKKKYLIGNIDCIIIAQKPKMSPYILKMEQNIAKILEINLEQINIKATTEEGLGFTGREEGIASKAICLIYNNV